MFTFQFAKKEDITEESNMATGGGGGFTFGAATFGATNKEVTVSPSPSPFGTPIPVAKLTGLTAAGETKSPEVKVPQEIFTKLDNPWRVVQGTEDERSSLVEKISSYAPCCRDVPRANVLLLGPVGCGKSSFISSVQSVFDGRVTNRAMVGRASSSFTKKLQSFVIRGGEDVSHTAVAMYDIMGFGDGDMTGPTLHDVLTVVKGHAPEGHKFSPDQALNSEVEGYIKRPGLRDQIHCVVFVLDASEVLTHVYSKGLSVTFQKLREHISDLGVHQVALLTHIDKICPGTAKDVSEVYKSRIIKETISKAGDLLGMSSSYIVPVKNYSSELEVDVGSDVLLLRAVDHILQYTELFFREQTEQQGQSKKPGL